MGHPVSRFQPTVAGQPVGSPSGTFVNPRQNRGTSSAQPGVVWGPPKRHKSRFQPTVAGKLPRQTPPSSSTPPYVPGPPPKLKSHIYATVNEGLPPRSAYMSHGNEPSLSSCPQTTGAMSELQTRTLISYQDAPTAPVLPDLCYEELTKQQVLRRYMRSYPLEVWKLELYFRAGYDVQLGSYYRNSHWDYEWNEEGDAYNVVYLDKFDLDEFEAAAHLHELLEKFIESDPRLRELVQMYATSDAFEQSELVQFQRLRGYSRLAERLQTGADVAIVCMSIVNEGADYAVTISELSEGNFEAVIGFLPLVPAGVAKIDNIIIKSADDGAEYVLKQIPGKNSGFHVLDNAGNVVYDSMARKVPTSGATDAAREMLDVGRKTADDVIGNAPNSEVYSLALGLSRHPNHTRSGLLMRFADKVDDNNVRHYWQLIDEMGLPNAAVGKQLEGQLLDFMKNSKHIHLNLDGMLDTLDAAKLKEILKLGEQGTRVPQNITRWEFLQVWAKFRDKATFYFDGKAVDLTDLLQ